MSGRDLTDRMPRQELRTDPPRLDQPEQRHLKSEQRRLRERRLVDPLTREDDLAQRQVHLPVQLRAHRVERRREHRERLIQLSAHPGTLTALAGEQERRPPHRAGRPQHRARRRCAGRERGQLRVEEVESGNRQHGTVLEGAPCGGERPADVEERGLGLLAQVVAQSLGLGAQRLGALGGQHHGQHPGGRRRVRLGGRGAARRGRLLDDGVGVGAADPEGGDAGAAGTAGPRPLARLGQQLDRALSPVHVRGRLGDVQRLRQHTVPHRHDDLDDARHARCSLGVPQVRLDRAEPERPVGRALAAVGGQQRLGLDRVAQGGAGAVRLDQVDLVGAERRRGQGLADDPLLRGAVGGGQPVAGAVLVDRRAAHDREHRVTVAAGVGEPLDQQHARALGPAGAVRVVGEGLAASVAGEAALAAEVDEGAGSGHHGRATGERQRALAGAQRLDRPVQRDQRGGAGGVDGDRRALQPEHVGDPARGDAAGVAGPEVTLDARRDGGQAGDVVVVHDSGEDAGAAAVHGLRVDPGALERLPGRLQQQPLLRVHGQGLARADAEERRVELAGVVQESALAGVRGAGVVRVGVVQVLHVPAAVGGEGRDAVGALGDHPPQVLGRAHVARVAAGHADDGDRVVVGGRHDGCGLGGRLAETQRLGEEVVGERGGRRVVEDHGGGQPYAGHGVQAVAQLDRGERVETGLPEGLGRVDDVRARVAQHLGDLGADQLQQLTLLLLLPQRQQPVDQRGAGGGGACGGQPTGRGADQSAEDGGQAAGTGLLAQGRRVQPDRDERGGGPAERRIEEGQAQVRGERGDAVAGHPLHVGLVQGAGHAVRPQAPGQRGRRQSGCPAVLGEGVQEAVRRRIVALTSRTEHPGSRGEHHEGGEILLLRQLVEVPGRVHLGTQHGVDALRRQRGDDAVVQHTGGVHHGGQRVLQRAQQLGQRGTVGDVAGRDGDLRAQLAQFGSEFGGSGSLGPAPRDQQQATRTVRGHQVPGEQPAQSAGGPGEQHGALGVQLRRIAFACRYPCQTRRERRTRTQGELRLTGVDGGGEHGRRGRVLVQIDEHDPARVLRLRRTHQTPHRGGGQVTDVLTVTGGHRSARDDHQPRVRENVLGQPGLQQFERAVDLLAHLLRGDRPCAGADRQVERAGRVVLLAVQTGGEGGQVLGGVDAVTGGQQPGGQAQPVGADHGVPLGLGVAVGQGEGGPVLDEESVGERGDPAVTGAQLLGGERPQHQALHRGDRRAGDVHGGQRHGVGARGRDPHPQGGGAHRVQRHAAPGERQAALGGLVALGGPGALQRGGVQGGVEQRRVQAEAGRFGGALLGEGDLGEDLLAAHPGGTQAAEGRAVAEPGLGESGVEVGQVHGPSVGGRPDGRVEAELGRGGRGAEQTFGVPGPRLVVGAVLGTGVDGQRAQARRVGLADP